MPGPLAVLFAIVVAVAEVLPLSGRGHSEVLGLALDVTMESLFRALAHFAAAISLAVLARRRLAAAVSDGLGALVRPRQATETRGAREAFGLAIAMGIGVGGALVLGRLSVGIADAPIAVGVGMLGTGVMLMSTSATTRIDDDTLGPRRAVIVGLCQAFAALAGGSATGAGIAALLWTGMRPRRAAETAALLAVPNEIAFALIALSQGSATRKLAERPGLAIAAFAAATIAGLLAGGRLVRIAERRLVAFGAYLAMLGAGAAAYGWALH